MLSSERSNKELTETDRDTSTIFLKSGTPAFELEKGWKKLGYRVIPLENQQSQITQIPESAQTLSHQHTRQHTRTAPETHTAENSLIWLQWEKKENGESREWGHLKDGGGVIILETGRRRNEVRNCGGSYWKGNSKCTVKK